MSKKRTKKSPHAHRIATKRNRTPLLMDILQHEKSDSDLIKKYGFASGGPIRCYRMGEVQKPAVIDLREKMGKKASKTLVAAAAKAKAALAEKMARKAKKKKKTSAKVKKASKRRTKTSDRLEKALAAKANRKAPAAVAVAVKSKKADIKPVEVKVDQVFKSNEDGTTKKVLGVKDGKAFVESSTGRKVMISVKRLTQGSAKKGYSLVG